MMIFKFVLSADWSWKLTRLQLPMIKVAKSKFSQVCLFSSCFYSSRRNVASPFADRALSVPPSTYTPGWEQWSWWWWWWWWNSFWFSPPRLHKLKFNIQQPLFRFWLQGIMNSRCAVLWARVVTSGVTLLWDIRRILDKPIIVLARQAQPTHWVLN